MIKQAALHCRVLLLCALPSLAQKKAPPKGDPLSRRAPIHARGVARGRRPQAGRAPHRRRGESSRQAAQRYRPLRGGQVQQRQQGAALLVDALQPALPHAPRQSAAQAGQGTRRQASRSASRSITASLPASGSMLEGIRQTFEEMLAAQGIKATVKAALTSGLGPQKITAINFTITSPAVRIGPIQLAGVSAAMQAKVNTPCRRPDRKRIRYREHRNRSSARLRGSLPGPGLCGRASRCDAKSSLPSFPINPSTIPFAVAIKEGGVYKLGSINYPADALVPRAEVEKVLSKYQAGSGRPLDLFLLAVRDAYHARGYLDCSVVSHPSFNEATHIVNYSARDRSRPDLSDGYSSVRRRSRCHGRPAHASLEDGARPAFRRKLRLNLRGARAKAGPHSGEMDANRHHHLRRKARPGHAQVNCIFHFAKAAQGGR